MFASTISRLDFRGRLLCVVLAAILPFAGFIAFQAFEIQGRRIGEALQRANHLTQIAARSYEATIAESRLLLENAAQILLMPGSMPSCAGALALMQRSHRWASGMSVVGPDGVVRCTTVANGVGINHSGREEYSNSAAASTFMVTDTFVSEVGKIPMATAILPITAPNTGERLLLAVSIDLSVLDWLPERIGLVQSPR